MKKFRSLIFFAFVLMLGSSCVSRTVTIDHQQRGEIPKQGKGRKYGNEAHSDLVEKKLVWFWQKEFRTPK